MRAAILLLLWPLAVGAHEVHHTVAATAAVAVSLSYADGKPFAYEKYELTPEGRQVPVQVGNTDAAGRVVFLPEGTRNWHLKAYSADGHGADLRFEAPVIATPAAPAAAPELDRASRMIFGLSILFGLFGLVQLLLRRRKP